MISKLKKRLNSNTAKSAMVAVAAKFAEKTVPNEVAWWISIAVGGIALFLIGFFADDSKETE